MELIREIVMNADNIKSDDMNRLEDWCLDAEDKGSHYPGMTYEQGIRDVLDWLSGNGDNPSDE